jgi:hypothetical protein
VAEAIGDAARNRLGVDSGSRPVRHESSEPASMGRDGLVRPLENAVRDSPQEASCWTRETHRREQLSAARAVPNE